MEIALLIISILLIIIVLLQSSKAENGAQILSGSTSDLFAQRITNEGWLQNVAKDYNRASVAEQKTFPWKDYMDNEISGYNQLGLDTFG